MTTTATEAATKTTAKVTPITKPRQSRATRAAAQAKATAPKPATTRKPAPGKASASKTSTAKPKAAPQPKSPAVNGQKQAVAAEILRVVADALSSNPPAGVSKADALEWAGQWLNYLPGVRQGKVTWDKRLGQITGAGSAKKD